MLTGTATGVSLSDGYINNQGQGSSFTYQNIGSYTNSDSSGNATQSSTSGELHDRQATASRSRSRASAAACR